ncbi:MAG TPA: toll/interleukin-1 receptor domain-containing protein, partial [Longimicrobiales bacterium]|nr:toll/interleukin-1 receptor domain-containing protein [Longimicrobiales bacterium]
MRGTPTPLRIFLSYGRDNYEDARILKEDLEARGHEVWLDIERLKPGVDWEMVIEEAVKWCDKVVLLMTPNSVRRRNPSVPNSTDGFCLNEITKALHFRRSIVPVMLVWVDDGPPTSICRIQWLDMTDCVPLSGRPPKYGTRLGQLIEAIETDRMDFEGGQQRLLDLLDPLDFEADLARHLGSFSGRRWLEARVDRWLASRSGPRIFWLLGAPGIGKTSLAVNLCHRRSDAFHMCVFGHEEKSDPRRAVLSIAYQLSTHLPEYADRLARVDPEKTSRNADTLFDDLILTPLARGLSPPNRNLLLVIDAIDEATTGSRNELADLISRRVPQLPDWFRVFITSRPDPQVTVSLQGLQPMKLEPDSNLNLADIREFFDASLRDLGHGVSGPLIDRLVERSEGSFLYASLVLEALRDGEMDVSNLAEAPRGMAAWYQRAFQRRFPDIETYERDLLPCIDVIIAQNSALPLSELEKALGVSGRELDRLLSKLGSLFPVRAGGTAGERIVAPIHKSLLDWLVQKDPTTMLAAAGVYAANPQKGARRLADRGWALYEAGALGDSPYQERFLASHLLDAGQHDRLHDLLCDLSMLDRAFEQGRRHEWMRLWRALPKHFGAAKSYQAALTRACAEKEDPALEAHFAGRIGSLFREMGDTGAALPFLERAIRIRSDTGEDSTIEHARALLVLADLHRMERQFEQAGALYRESLSLAEQEAGPASGEVAAVCHSLAEYHRDLRQYTEALGYNHRCVSIREAQVPRDPRALADSVNDTGVLLYEKGRTDAAMEFYERARDLWRKVPGPTTPGEATTLHNIAQLRGVDAAEADIGELYRALEILEGVYVPHHRNTQDCRRTLANRLRIRCRFMEALETRRVILENLQAVGTDSEAIEEARRRRDLTERRHARVVDILSPALAALEDGFAAIPNRAELVRAPLEELSRRVGCDRSTDDAAGRGVQVSEEHAETALLETVFQLGTFLADFGYYGAALSLLPAVLEMTRGLEDVERPRLYRALSRIQRCHVQLGDFEAAIEACEHRLRLAREDLPEGRDRFFGCLEGLADLRFAAGQYEEALATYGEAATESTEELGVRTPPATSRISRAARQLNIRGIRLKNEMH